jgi:hypothetical protein
MVVVIPMFHNLSLGLWEQIYDYKLWRVRWIVELMRMLAVFSFKNVRYFGTEFYWYLKNRGKIILAGCILRSCLRTTIRVSKTSQLSSVMTFCVLGGNTNEEATSVRKMPLLLLKCCARTLVTRSYKKWENSLKIIVLMNIIFGHELYTYVTVFRLCCAMSDCGLEN